MIFEDGRIQGEPHEGKAEQTDADISQAAIWDAAEQPEKRQPFQSPTERDPFAIELDRKDKREEKQRGASLPRQPRVAGSRVGRSVFDQEECARGIGEDENGREQSIAKLGRRPRNNFIDQPEMQRPGERADGPGQRLALFRREKWIGEEEEEKRGLPSERESRVTVREVQRLPFALHRPGEKERDQRHPTRAGDNTQSQQQHGEKEGRDKESGWIHDRKLCQRHEQEQER